MTVDGGKMSKSLGNGYTLDDLEARGNDPMHLRYLALLTSYRSVLNFTWDSLTAAKKAYQNITAALLKHKNAADKTDKAIIAELLNEFSGAINDDLNTPRALAVVNKAVKMVPSKDIYDLVTVKFDSVLSLQFDAAVTAAEKDDNLRAGEEIPPHITELAEQRQTAKSAKDYAAADKLRAEIEGQGFQIIDNSSGYEIKPK
jgi:cysteinyl-tRNA synthetase